MTTSADQINDLIGACTELKDTFESKRQGIQDALFAAADAYSDFDVTFCVDQATGDDDNTGTTDYPVKTIQRAIDLAPYGILVNVRVRGAYTTTRRYSTMGRRVRIMGHDGDWNLVSNPANYPALTISYGEINTGALEVFGFDISFGGYVDVLRFDLRLPGEADVLAAHPDLNANDRSKGLFSYANSSRMDAGGATVRFCNIDIPADYYGQLVGDFGGHYLQVAGVTTSGAGTIAGNVIAGVAAGTPASDYGHILMTNLETL